MKHKELIFLPLGGCREIGMNLNAYAFGTPADRRWILVDVGVTFGGPDTPGIDLIMPDPSFLETERDLFRQDTCQQFLQRTGCGCGSKIDDDSFSLFWNIDEFISQYHMCCGVIHCDATFSFDGLMMGWNAQIIAL